jgi:hypothetical protein
MTHFTRAIKNFKEKKGSGAVPIEIDLLLPKGERETILCDAYKMHGDFAIVSNIVQNGEKAQMVHIPVPLTLIEQIRVAYSPPAPEVKEEEKVKK